MVHDQMFALTRADGPVVTAIICHFRHRLAGRAGYGRQLWVL